MKVGRKKNFQIICEMKTSWPPKNLQDCGNNFFLKNKKKLSTITQAKDEKFFYDFFVDVARLCRRKFFQLKMSP